MVRGLYCGRSCCFGARFRHCLERRIRCPGRVVLPVREDPRNHPPPRWVSAAVESEGIAVAPERPPARSAPRGFRRGEETRHGGQDSFAKDRYSPLGGPVLTSGVGAGKCALQESFPRLGWRWVRVLARGMKYFTGGGMVLRGWAGINNPRQREGLPARDFPNIKRRRFPGRARGDREHLCGGGELPERVHCP